MLAMIAIFIVPWLLIAGEKTAPSRLAIEQEVYRVLIDSLYTVPVDSGSRVLRDVMVYDHFAGPGRIFGDTAMWRQPLELLRNSVPELPDDARADYGTRQVDSVAIMDAMSSTDPAAVAGGDLPFPRTRAHVRLLADTTLSHFFSDSPRDHATGWTGFRAAYPNGTGIVTLSRIGLSRDERWAVVYAAQQSDWLAGVGGLYVLQRSARGWRIVKWRMLWVS